MSEETEQTRRRVLQTLGSVAVVGLAGCNSAPSSTTPGSTDTPTEAPTDTSTPTATPTETPTETPPPEETTAHDGHTHTHTDRPKNPPADVDFVENSEEVHPTMTDATTVPSDEVLVGFRLEDSSLPFTTQVYHTPADADLQATKTYDTQDLSQVDLVPDPPRALETVDTDNEDVHYATTAVGEPLTVTLVAQNDDESFEWSAWDRTGYPYDGHNEEDPALRVACYCGGEIYTAPSGGTWARVIQVTPTERVDPGSTVVVNWTSSRTP